MNKSMLTGTVLGVAVATAAGSIAGYRMVSGPDYADVVSVAPVTERISNPREECENVVVTRQKPVQDQHRIAGTLIGAVGGALAGDALGGGGKNTGAKVAGAVVGGYTGNKVQENMQAGDTYQTTERRCNTVQDVSERTVAYNVTYELNGETGKVQMDYDPGATIPVRDGKLVLARD
ncbi:glycine zipper 2TM domain-containing protein [Haliea sp. E17]|uniref:glycine zipper 2TM domain-containing protein n=1 Tax=Haliea sp. E17 TaxID=3401576 RepID=UPI003AAC64D0